MLYSRCSLSLGEMQGNPDKPLPEFVTRNQIVAVRDGIGAAENYLMPPEAVEAVPPITVLGEKAAFIGHSQHQP
jgi:hypothetical protein